MNGMDSDEDDPLGNNMFQEPQGYREAERPATYAEHTLLSGETLRLRLVGHNPLWVSEALSYDYTQRIAEVCRSRVTIFGMAAKS